MVKMANLNEGLEATFGSLVDGDENTIEAAVEAINNDEDFASIVKALVSSTRALKKRPLEIQVVAAAALLLNYKEYKEN